MHLLGKSALIFLLFLISLNPGADWELSVNKNLVDKEKKNLCFNENDMIIVISRKQCSRCNRSMIDLINLLQKSDKDVTIIRLLDSSLMECKQDELFFRDEHPNIPFEYISEPVINLIQSEVDSTTILLDQTPILISTARKVKTYGPDILVDEYGRLRRFRLN